MADVLCNLNVSVLARIMSLAEAKTGNKNIFFDLKKIATKNKKKDGSGPSRGTKKGPIVETYPPRPQ